MVSLDVTRLNPSDIQKAVALNDEVDGYLVYVATLS